ncbi:MAG: 3-phosphoshikimate 1-carboxyvinyltransferase [Candidatus Omnitrophota bacterium]|jgi:3-phosphoshikimate 1-carboxyvinyltransferase
MKPFLVKPALTVPRSRLSLPGDKSIAHRAIILSSLASGTTIIRNFPANEDCLYTLEAFRKLGVRIASRGKYIKVYGRGSGVFRRPRSAIFVGNSGTTMRLMMGVLAGCNFRVKLSAAKSLSARPMLRVSAPLRMMGARVTCRRFSSKKEEYPPVVLHGKNVLLPVTYRIPVASAQVKSAILLAALNADGLTRLTEPLATRDHTERMLRFFDAGIKTSGRVIFLKGKSALRSPGILYIPADISSASFFMVLAAIIAGSRISITRVGLNPSRLGILRVLKRMGADIKVKKCILKSAGFEPLGDITVKGGVLRPVRVSAREIPSLIDELPLLMVAACFADGVSVFKGAEELRVKETDRIYSVSSNLKRMGADVRVASRGGLDTVIIRGGRVLKGCRIRSFGDHRTAMSMVIAALAATGNSVLDDPGCINKSFPGFLSILKRILR